MTAVLTRSAPVGGVAVSGAASTAIRGLVEGPRRPLTLLAAFPSAVYLTTGDSTVLAAVAPGSVRLPCAVVMPSAADLPDGEVLTGESWVGLGGLTLDGRRVEITQWWRPTPPAPPMSVEVLARGLDALTARLSVQQHRLLRAISDGLRRLEAAVRMREPDPAADAASALIGLGPGLTPSGDDVVSGFLVGLHHLAVPREPSRNGHALTAARAHVKDRIAGRVLIEAPVRTTTLSAALLGHAARGHAAAEVTAVLNALSGRRPLSPVLMRLMAVGHSSGYDMACGILAAGRALLGQREG